MLMNILMKVDLKEKCTLGTDSEATMLMTLINL